MGIYNITNIVTMKHVKVTQQCTISLHDAIVYLIEFVIQMYNKSHNSSLQTKSSQLGNVRRLNL